MQTVETLTRNAERLDKRLKFPEHYWAHIPSIKGIQKEETLSQHLDLVLKYFVKIFNANGLDTVIDSLVNSVVGELISDNINFIKDYIKELFIDSVVFHDYGKVNENFQVDRMQNDYFKNCNTVIKPAHGHSELSTFIYLNYHIEKINQNTELGEDDKLFLSFISFLLTNSITLHHSTELKDPIVRLEKSFILKQVNSLMKYLDLYQMPKSEFAVSYFDHFSEAVGSVELTDNQYFPLFALTKLSFSLLTASDYLATSEYMNQKELKDLGLIDEGLRTRIYNAVQNSQPYNSVAFELADSDIAIINPIEKSGDNLNALRQNMAVEVIRNIRKNNAKQLLYLEAPTGGGKTNLSMLIVAELLKGNPKINKVFYVFPFTTLITQTHKAIKKILGLNDGEISLLHAKAGFQTKEEDDDYGDKKTDYINNLFIHYPFCLLTHIRFFDILKTSEKETNYLFHKLANSIVIIDELQSYAPKHWDKMVYFIQQYASFFNVHFVLMSATLPRIDKLKLPLANMPEFTDLLPNAKEYFINPNFSERVKFRFDYRSRTLEMDELASIVLEKSSEYILERQQLSIFTIVEFIFKKSATEFYEAINGSFFDEIFVLSGTILEPRRREIINYLKNTKNRNRKVLLITTQVVEAGVDIDMDLGFKNVSLIDSDEQLAGRVNRNVKKGTSEVYLFQINQPSLLYKQDDRYIVTRDKITESEHEEILASKNFEKLYDLVITNIDKINGLKGIQNFRSDYLPEIKRLNYREVHHKFKLIDQENLSVFVPLKLKSQILSEDNEPEDVFSKSELDFLFKVGVNLSSDSIDGYEIWKIYKSILKNKTEDFIDKQIDKKIINGILSKFTFSIFSNNKIKQVLNSFGFPSTDDENELRGFDNYVFLAHYEKCYEYEKGLIEKQFDATENFIL